MQEKNVITIKEGTENEHSFVVPMAMEELNKIIKELGNKWMIYLIKAVEADNKEKMGELAECKPDWYSTDYFFGEDVIADNLRLAYKYKQSQID